MEYPSASGVFDFTVRVTDAAGLFSEQLCVLSVLKPVVPPADLVAWWRGEPATGGLVPDIIGGNDGSFFSGNTAATPSYTIDGKVGSAFTFDGTLYVQIPDAVGLRPSELTVEAWVFPIVQTENHQTIIARGSSANNDDAWCLGIFNGRPRFWSNHSGSGMKLLELPSTIPLDRWTHLAITFDGTTKRLYVNGVDVGSQGSLSMLVYSTPVVPVTIGGDWAFNSPADLFHGRLDEVSFYSRALSAAEIASIYDADVAGKAFH